MVGLKFHIGLTIYKINSENNFIAYINWKFVLVASYSTCMISKVSCVGSICCSGTSYSFSNS